MGACGVCRIWGAAPRSAAAASRAGAAPGCWRWFCAGSPPRLHCGALWLLLSAISGLPGSAWSRTCCLCLRCSVNEPGRVHHRAASCLFHPDQFLDEVLWRKKAVLQLMLHLVPTSLSWSCGLQHPAAHSMEHGILRGDGGQLSFAAEFPGKEFPATAALFPKDSISRNFPLSPPPTLPLLETSSAFPSKPLACGHVCGNWSRADPWERRAAAGAGRSSVHSSYLHRVPRAQALSCSASLGSTAFPEC